MKIIVGLGNPGEKYQNTRHNLGFMVVDKLISKLKSQNSKLHFKSKIYPFAEVYDFGEVIIAKPLTFINASGVAVAKLTRRYRLDAKSLWVIHDDIDLPLGKIKIRLGGGSAGHRGVESIIRELGTEEFMRFRLGIGHPRRNLKFLHAGRQGKTENLKSVEGYVLEKFQTKEKSEVKKTIKKAIKAIRVALEKGPERAMNEFNA